MITDSQWKSILSDIKKVRLKYGNQLKFVANDGEMYDIHSVQESMVLLGKEGETAVNKKYFKSLSYSQVQSRFAMTKHVLLSELI